MPSSDLVKEKYGHFSTLHSVDKYYVLTTYIQALWGVHRNIQRDPEPLRQCHTLGGSQDVAHKSKQSAVKGENNFYGRWALWEVGQEGDLGDVEGSGRPSGGGKSHWRQCSAALSLCFRGWNGAHLCFIISTGSFFLLQFCGLSQIWQQLPL